MLNAATSEFKQLLADMNNASFQTFLQDLSPTAFTDYSLWKAAKKAKQATNSSHPLSTTRGTWATTNTEKAQTFTDHLTSVFQPHPSTRRGRSPYQLEPLLSRLIDQKFKLSSTTSNLKVPHATTLSRAKAFRNYLLLSSNKTFQELPPAVIKYLAQIFNAAMLTGYFPAQWKVAKIILHLKPGKPSNEPISHRPINLLPILSKVYEKLLLHHLLPIIENRWLLPDHQVGFCQ
jgi:hypothetical protein